MLYVFTQSTQSRTTHRQRGSEPQSGTGSGHGHHKKDAHQGAKNKPLLCCSKSIAPEPWELKNIRLCSSGQDSLAIRVYSIRTAHHEPSYYPTIPQFSCPLKYEGMDQIIGDSDQPFSNRASQLTAYSRSVSKMTPKRKPFNFNLAFRILAGLIHRGLVHYCSC